MVRKQCSDQTKLLQSKHQYTTRLMFMKGLSIYKAITKTFPFTLVCTRELQAMFKSCRISIQTPTRFHP